MNARIGATALGAVLVLAGCGGGDAEDSASPSTTSASPTSSSTRPSPTTSSAPRTTTPSGPVVNSRGNIVKALGEEAGFASASGAPSVSFAIDSVAVDIPCTAPYYDYAPENGHMIGLQMRATTSSDLSDFGGSYSLEAKDFSFVGSSGTTLTNAYTLPAYACLPTGEQFTSQPLNPGQQFTGIIVLDVPETSGVLIYTPPSGLTNASGWEWPF